MASIQNVTGRSAVLSEDRVYRYSLRRDWAFVIAPRCVFVMLNPSTADETKDDPTIRRCIDYAARWGASGLTVVNMFAYRATKPSDLLRANDKALIDIVGPDNDDHIEAAFREGFLDSMAPLVVCAWGANAEGYGARVESIRYIARHVGVPLMALGLTATGQPIHPLYQPKVALPVPF